MRLVYLFNVILQQYVTYTRRNLHKTFSHNKTLENFSRSGIYRKNLYPVNRGIYAPHRERSHRIRATTYMVYLLHRNRNMSQPLNAPPIKWFPNE